jgi:hypothetical protein
MAIDDRWNRGWKSQQTNSKDKANPSIFSRAFKKLEDQMEGRDKALKAKLVLAWFVAAAILIGIIEPVILLFMAGAACVGGVIVFPLFLVKPSMKGYFYKGGKGD